MSFSSQKANHRRSRIDFKGSQSLTEQSQAKHCDIHTIMKKYERTGIIEHANAHKGTYMDLPTAPDFHAAQNIIAEANSMFESVPSAIRAKFKNDPVQYIEFMQNKDNREAIEEMGLDASHLPKPPPQEEVISEKSTTPVVEPPTAE